MNKRIFIKPKEGCIMRDPRTNIKIKAEGQTVVENTFWRRRLKAGDVVLIDAEILIPSNFPAVEKPVKKEQKKNTNFKKENK